MNKAGENVCGRKYYPTLTQNKSYHVVWAKGIHVLCLDCKKDWLLDKLSRSWKTTNKLQQLFFLVIVD